MARISARWRRLWGIRPAFALPPLLLVGRKRRMGEPKQGPQGRGALVRRRLERRR